MNRSTTFTAEINQTDKDILYDEVSDETLEAAAAGEAHRGPTMVTVGPSCC